jgi:hypothetical protein
VIIDDIRRRSIRVQRDQFLEQIRREEEIDNMSISKRFILEAEERARERINDQGWKKTFFFSLLVLVGGVLFVILLRKNNRDTTLQNLPKIGKMETEIQTEETTPPLKKNVRFEETRDLPDETDERGYVLSRLMEEFPTNWRDFTPDLGPENLVSDLSGNLVFNFYDEEKRVAVDFDPEDFFQFPNSITNDEIRFQNMIYDKKLKRSFCEENGIDYYELSL